MILNKFLIEIKNRFFFFLMSWFFLLFICFFYKETLLYIIIKPSFIFHTNHFYFIFTHLSELFFNYMHLIFFTSFQIIYFFIIFQIFSFFSPGMYMYEKTIVKFIIYFSFFFWFFSFLILYHIILPWSWQFFLNFQKNLNNLDTITYFFEAKLSEYLNFFKNLYFFCALNCQLFMLLLIFLNLLKKKLNFIKNFRKFFFFSFFTLSTIITPPDIFNQVVLSFYIIIFFEIIIVFLIVKKKLIKIIKT